MASNGAHTRTTVYDVHEGRPSWHQARAGGTCAAMTVGFSTRADAEAHIARLRVHHPGMVAYVVERNATQID